ncbi:cytochrome C biogenesis protein [Opitutaceae bacterium EW11]|nr:cytochrome C biogenesis protein [Opitutaceae bacterium EW11]
MKKLLPWLVFAAGLVFVGAGLFTGRERSAYLLDEFAHLPVLLNGRIKPVDTVARTSLLSMQDRQRVMSPEGREIAPIEWLLDVAFNGEKADGYRTFKIDNPDLLSLIGKTEDNIKIEYDSTAKRVMAVLGFLPSRYRRFTYTEISPYLAELERQAQLAQSVENAQRSGFQKAVLSLYNSLITYQQLKYSFVLPESPDFLAELHGFVSALPKGIEAVRAKQAGQPHDEAVAQQMVDAVRRFETMSRFGSLLAAPPLPGAPVTQWRKIGDALLDSFKTGELNVAANTYATLGHAWRTGNPEQFNQAVTRYRDHLLGSVGERMDKSNAELRFNQAEPFYRSMILFLVVFLVGIASWFRAPYFLSRSAFFLLLAAFIATTAGIATRMWLEGRPPVTNLYSSALFIGWAAVALCLILEAIYKNAVGAVAGGAIGFCTLLIAHHLSFGGDTMEMMRAVLDSNFWLATHVVVITLGYASTFLAGFLAIIYILLGTMTRWLSKQFDRNLSMQAAPAAGAGAGGPAARKGETNGEAINRMVYGIICFATLFSLIGTILGGIWADQSWGRFWGWDPKENGAMIIVIWNALILHARWGGMVKARGLMNLAVFGNVVTAWSWFGTNMLGIGLHSYGFMEAAFKWLVAFVVCQIAIILLGALLPTEKWKSFRSIAPRGPSSGSPRPQTAGSAS